ncbi:hypothetical protein V8C34DRAFT_318450 [Trichoderma compactum]
MLLRRQNRAFDHLGACDWIFETAVFVQWRDQDDFKRHNGVLWIKGAPVLTNKKIYRRIERQESELQNFLFFEMRQHRPRPLLFIVDVLDECADSDRLGKLEIVVERSDEHHRGIAKYTRNKLKLKPSEIQNLILVVAKLNEAYDRGQVEVADMRETLDQIPGDLEDLFQTLLNKDDGNKDEMMLMLQWVLYSMRPLKLEEDPELGQNATFTSHDRLRACCLECITTEGVGDKTKDAP